MFKATVIEDSIWLGHRLTTIEATYPRFIHSELLTHRMLSRNSASSRAVPVEMMIARVSKDPVMPVHWGANKRGMSASEEIDDVWKAGHIWLEAVDNAVSSAMKLQQLGVHKQVVNRLLEPFLWHTTIITATEWDNFFDLRLAKDSDGTPQSQPEMYHLAKLMKCAIDSSTPIERNMHCPYISEEERNIYDAIAIFDISAARCARVSYLNHDGTRDIHKDLDLAKRLKRDKHLSPFEHVADALPGTHANFKGWCSYRESLTF